MAVALDVAGTIFSGTVSPVASSASITVGASATCLYITVYDDDPAASISAPTWNGVASTLLLAVTTTDSTARTLIYGLVNPASGANSLSVSWTGGAPNVIVVASSYTGSVTSSVAACFTNVTSQNNISGTAQALTITSATGNMTVVSSDGNNDTNVTLSATGSVSLFNSTTTAVICGGARAPGAASVAWTGTLGSAVTNNILGCNIVASAGGATTPTSMNFPRWSDGFFEIEPMSHD